MPSARLPSQPKTLATLTECSEDTSSRNARINSDIKRGSVLNSKDESQEEMSTDLSSRSTVSKGQCGAFESQHLYHNHHHKQHHKYLRGGSTSAKLVTTHSKSTEPMYKLKHHQPHCQHYSLSQHQKKQYHHQSHHHLQQPQQHVTHHHHQHHQGGSNRSQHPASCRLHRTSSDLSNDIVAKNFRCKASRLITKQKDAPYLLVDHLPVSAAYQGEFKFHQAAISRSGYSNNNNLGNNDANRGQPRYSREAAVCRENFKRATVKFISQLYFLLHLSAILSLLLHHKSLTAAVEGGGQRKPTGEFNSECCLALSPVAQSPLMAY